MKSNRVAVLLSICFKGAALLLAVCFLTASSTKLKDPEIAVNLPDKYNTPDGMTLGPDNHIYLSVPNFNNSQYPPTILRITPDDQIQEVIDVPLHPELNAAGPLGIAFGSDGNLYVADNVSGVDPNYKSRLLRINMKDGKAINCETVVTGFVLPNGVKARGDYIYVTESMLNANIYPALSGVYRFKVSEMSGEPIQLQGARDPHLVTAILNYHKEIKVGANGLAFDSKGNLYVSKFGDAELLKYSFNSDGNADSVEVFAKDPALKSGDGVFIDSDDNIYVADFLANAIHHIDSGSGKLTTVARNGQTDGRDGELDGPSALCMRDGKLYISNIDLAMGENTADDLHTISVIDLHP